VSVAAVLLALLALVALVVAAAVLVLRLAVLRVPTVALRRLLARRFRLVHLVPAAGIPAGLLVRSAVRGQAFPSPVRLAAVLAVVVAAAARSTVTARAPLVAPLAWLQQAQRRSALVAVVVARMPLATLVAARVSRSPIMPDFRKPQPFNVDLSAPEASDTNSPRDMFSFGMPEVPVHDGIEPDADLYGPRGPGVLTTRMRRW